MIVLLQAFLEDADAKNANMACTSFSTCQGGDGCFNPKTRERIQADDESNDEMNDEGDDDETDCV